MSELFDNQVKKENFQGSSKLPQTHKKCSMKMKERNKQTNKQTNLQWLAHSFVGLVVLISIVAWVTDSIWLECAESLITK